MNSIRSFQVTGMLTLLLVSAFIVSCGDDDPTPSLQPQPIASFSFVVDELTVEFTDASRDATSYRWNFGDGNSSRAESPSHTYAAEGDYEVTLTATNGSHQDSHTQTVAVMQTQEPTGDEYTTLLSNQIDEVIIPTYERYQAEASTFATAVEAFVGDVTQDNLDAVKAAYASAYKAYQAGALHDYYATANLDLVNTTNLYPVDADLLEEFIDNESYNFNASAQRRANGYPAVDYLLFGSEDAVAAFTGQPKRGAFLLELAKSIKIKSDDLVTRWTGTLKENFVNNGGTGLGSSISVQLNGILVYYEDHIRGNKVGLPIGRLGPLDTPIDPDETKIEAYYQSEADGNDSFTLALLKATMEEMEHIYLGTTSTGMDGQGYDDLLMARGQGSIDTDIKAQYQLIYQLIDHRSTILGDTELYDAIQGLNTLYKSDMLPVLNVQDADGANDGD